MSDYHWYDILARWVTADGPRRVFFSGVVLMWLVNLNVFFFEGEGLLFFGLGVWMQKTRFDIAHAKRWMHPIAWAVVALVAALTKTGLAFEGHAPLVAVLIDPTIAVFAALPQPQLWAYVVLPATKASKSIADSGCE